MLGAPDLVFLGIRAAVALARAGRTIEAEKALRIDLALPPAIDLSGPFETAERALIDAGHAEANTPRRRAFDAVFERVLDRNDKHEILAVYREYVARGVLEGPAGVDDIVIGLEVIRDRDDDAFPSPIQRIAGTLANIAVDYFANAPGVISEDSPRGRAVLAVLRSLDGVRFDESAGDELVAALFTASLDALAAHPDVFAAHDPSDPDAPAALLHAAVGGVAENLKLRLDALDEHALFSERDRLKAVASAGLRAVLDGVAAAALEHPGAIGVRHPSDRALLAGVGGALTDLLLGDPEDPDHELAEGLRTLASTDGLARLGHAALAVAAQNPEIIRTDDEDAQQWLRNTVIDLYDVLPAPNDVLDPELFAAVTRTVLERSIHDLQDLLLEPLPGGARPLVVETAAAVLDALITPADGETPARWSFGVSRDEATAIVDASLGALADHPEWLFRKPAHKKIAAAAVPLAVDALARAEPNGGLLKSLARSDKLGPVVAAVLSSGLGEKLTKLDPAPSAEELGELIAAVVRAVEHDGLTGLDAVVAYPTLADLFAAAADKRSGVPGAITAGPSERRAVAKKVAAVVAELRAGAILARPEITRRLKGPNG